METDTRNELSNCGKFEKSAKAKDIERQTQREAATNAMKGSGRGKIEVDTKSAQNGDRVKTKRGKST